MSVYGKDLEAVSTDIMPLENAVSAHHIANRRNDKLLDLVTNSSQFALPNDLWLLIVQLCDDAFLIFIDGLTANDLFFEKFFIFARQMHRDAVQVQFVLIDQCGTHYSTDAVYGVNFQKIDNEEKFDQVMLQRGFAKIEDIAFGIEEIEIEPVDFCDFVLAKNVRNFSTDFTYDFINELLGIKRWKTSDGFSWFLKAMISKINLGVAIYPDIGQLRICEAIVNNQSFGVVDLRSYIRKTIVVQSNCCQWMQLANGQNIKIIKLDLGQPLLCVIKEQFIIPDPQNGVETAPHCRSELDFGYSADILSKYGVPNQVIPQSFRQAHSFKEQLKQKDKIRSFIVEASFKMKQIIERTKWNIVPARNQGIEYVANEHELIKDINELNDFKNPTLIPIIMFNTESTKKIKFWIEFVWIVKIRQDSHIGISMIYNEEEDSVAITGIHTDKEFILNQHQLISPIYLDYYLRDFEFDSQDILLLRREDADDII